MPARRAAVLLAASLALPAVAQEKPEDHELLSVRSRALYLFIDGTVAAGEGRESFVEGETFGVREDLEIFGGPWADLEIRLRVSPGDRFRAHLFYGRGSADRKLDESFYFNGEDHVVDERIREDISLGFYGLGYDRRLWRDDTFEIWGGVGLVHTHASVKVKISRPLVEHKDLDNGENVRAICPALHLEGRFRLSDELSLQAEFLAGAYGLDVLLDEPGDVRFLRGELGLQWRPTPAVELELGVNAITYWSRYRGLEKGEGTPDVNIDSFRLWGPYVAVSIRF